MVLGPDARAARAHGTPLLRWGFEALTCRAKSGLNLDYPLPILRTKALGRLAALSGSSVPRR